MNRDSTYYIEEIKAKQGVNSDYAVSKLLGVERQMMTKYKNGRSSFDSDLAFRVAELSGHDPLEIIANCKAAKAKDPEIMKRWAEIARRVAGTAAAVILSLAALFAAPQDANATPSPAVDFPNTTYYVKLVMCRNNIITDYYSTPLLEVSMPKSGQARVLTTDQQDHLFQVIKQHRHPEKNTAIMQISFKLALRAQEIALLQIKEVAQLNPAGTDFKLLEVMSLPAAYTKGANALGRSKTQYQRKTISFDIESFHNMVRQIEVLARSGAEINPETFYPPVKKHKGKSRDLPMVDKDLRSALSDYLTLRIQKAQSLKPSVPLFISQKGGPYSPNTLQEHMGFMLKNWAGVEKASSHSGRRSLITNVIHKQKKSVKVAQKIAGHVNPSTTLIYEEPPEEQVSDALGNL